MLNRVSCYAKEGVGLRKIIIILAAALLLTGCKLSIRQKSGSDDQPDITADGPVGVQDHAVGSDASEGLNSQPAAAQMDETVQESDVTNTVIADDENTDAVRSIWDSSVRKESITGSWYAGMIGDVSIHARFDISEDRLTGTYYYDKYKTEIPLEGYIDDVIKGMLMMHLTEDTDEKGSIYALFRTEEYVQGFWRSGETLYPMYLIKEGADVEPPKPAAADMLAYKGLWYGSRSYYSGGEAIFTPLFSDLVFYDLSAYNGGSSGWLESFGVLENGSFKTVFVDKTYEGNENVMFSFKLKDKILVLESNMYDYMCGMGVTFPAEYTRERMDVPIPSAQDAGIVDSEEMERIFREITGDDFENFISYTQFVQYEDITLDGRPAAAGTSYLRGIPGMCFYVVADNKIYAAFNDFGTVRYYTNDKKYAKDLPEPIKEWVPDWNAEIRYNYKEVK